MKDEVIILTTVAGLFFVAFILIVTADGISSAPKYKCVTQAIEAKISADDIQKICYNR